jgi:hypothetical protein
MEKTANPAILRQEESWVPSVFFIIAARPAVPGTAASSLKIEYPALSLN